MSQAVKNRTGCNCCSCGAIRAVVRVCPGPTAVVSATVTVKDSLGATVGTCTTDASGICTVAIPSAGTYTVTAAKSGQVTTTVTATVTCTTTDVIVELGRVLSVTVRGCAVTGLANTIAGATVTATLGADSYTGTTNGSGVIAIPIQANGTYTVTVTEATGRLTYSASVVVACGTTTHTANMTAAAGYHCIDWTSAWGCAPYPIADTLFLTDALYGAVTLTWNGTNAWVGTKTITTPACNLGSFSCPSQAGIPLTYTLSQTSTLNTTTGGGRNACTPGWHVNATSGCPDTTGATTGLQVRITAVTCPTAAFSSTHHVAGTSPPFGTPNTMYCYAGTTITITE